MPYDGDDDEREPVLRPRLINALRKRPRLVSFGFREEVLGELEDVVVNRRTTDAVAERAARNVAESGRQATEKVVKHRAKDKLDSANRGPLKRL